MSAYENDTAVSSDYDRTRVPVGVEIILGCLASGGRPLASLRLLDAGCGTGSYSAALCRYVGAIDAVDLNPSMLGVAQSKLDRTPGCPVTLQEAGIDTLPFEDACFDAVMVNQVLHHLPDSPQDGWPMLRRVLGEFARVVRPGGAAIINTCSHEQLRRGWWYTALVPGTFEAIGGRHDAVSRVRPPNSITPAGLAAAEAALLDRGHLDRVVREVLRLREAFCRQVRVLGLEAGPSHGNFVLVRFPEDGPIDARETFERLKGAGIIVRPTAGHGLADCLRVTVGSAEEMAALSGELERIVANIGQTGPRPSSSTH